MENINTLISFFTLAAIFSLAVYHTNLFFFNRINFLGKYTLYLWTVFIFSLLLTTVLKNESPGKLFPYIFISTTFWFSVWLYFSFIISALSFEMRKNSFTHLLFTKSWVLAIFCIACHAFNHMVTDSSIKPFALAIMFISELLALTFACMVIWTTYKTKRDFFNINILIGTALIVIINSFSVYYKLTGVKIFGLTNIGFICIGFFFETVFFSIATSFKLQENLRSKYQALLKISRQNLVLEMEKKKASDELISHEFEILKQREEAKLEQRVIIGRNLHDNLSNSLISLKYFITDKHRNAASESEQKNLIQIIDEIDTIYSETRSFSHLLTKNIIGPQTFDIDNYLVKLHERFIDLNLFDLEINYDKHLLTTQLSPEISEEMYLFIKECLSNIIKHANAKKISITISLQDEFYVVIIKDDGKGFNPEQSNVGIGLNNLRNRIENLNGTFVIESEKGKTSMIANIPINQKISDSILLL